MTPIRTCVACRRTAARGDLQRHVARDGVIVVDPSRSMPGRGAWLHDDEACRELAARRRSLERALRLLV